MLQYIYKDIASVTQYLRVGLEVGIPIATVSICLINSRRKRKGGERLRLVSFICFCVYLMFMLTVTLLNREGGSTEGIDLVLFSTLNINTRNKAYVAENILLFLPYGFLCCSNFKVLRNPVLCTLFGLVTSFGIEVTQLFTGRGVFQVDDIWTNTLGMLLGVLLYQFVAPHNRRVKERIQADK